MFKVNLRFVWFDIWIGVYIDAKTKGQITFYICLVPTLLLTIAYHEHVWTYQGGQGVVCTKCNSPYKRGK